MYSRRDVENLMRVRDLLYADGFTIAGAKKKLQRAEPDSLGGEEYPRATGTGAVSQGPTRSEARFARRPKRLPSLRR